MGWVQPKRREPFLLGAVPVWAIGHDDGSLHYGFPITAESPAMKIAHHKPGEASADPDTIDRNPQKGDEKNLPRRSVKLFLPRTPTARSNPFASACT